MGRNLQERSQQPDVVVKSSLHKSFGFRHTRCMKTVGTLGSRSKLLQRSQFSLPTERLLIKWHRSFSKVSLSHQVRQSVWRWRAAPPLIEAHRVRVCLRVSAAQSQVKYPPSDRTKCQRGLPTAATFTLIDSPHPLPSPPRPPPPSPGPPLSSPHNVENISHNHDDRLGPREPFLSHFTIKSLFRNLLFCSLHTSRLHAR